MNSIECRTHLQAAQQAADLRLKQSRPAPWFGFIGDQQIRADDRPRRMMMRAFAMFERVGFGREEPPQRDYPHLRSRRIAATIIIAAGDRLQTGSLIADEPTTRWT